LNIYIVSIQNVLRSFTNGKAARLFKQMSDGTSIDALESGNVRDTADASRVQAILQDMNASGADMGSQGHMQGPPMMPQGQQMMPPMPPMQPMPSMMQRPPSQYIPLEEERKPARKNVWSSVFERIRDPLVVALLVFVLSLPVLHIFLGKYASWAFAVGGQLSWLGLIALSLLSGLLFGTYKAVSDLVA
jgi:hypothetical protein